MAFSPDRERARILAGEGGAGHPTLVLKELLRTDSP